MEDDFDNVLELETQFYKEGYDLGVEDGRQAGMIEGRIFGIEKGFEKALRMGRLHGRGRIWEARSEESERTSPEPSKTNGKHNDEVQYDLQVKAVAPQLEPLPKSSRLQKHIETLLGLTGSSTLPTENSDQAVADFDDKIARADARAKVISNVVGERIDGLEVGSANIEDSRGLNARH